MNILFVCVVFALSSVSETITPAVGEKPTVKESPPVIIDHGGLIPPSPSTSISATNLTVSKKPTPEQVANSLPLLPGPQIISGKDNVEINKKGQDGVETSKSHDDEEDDEEEAGDEDDDDYDAEEDVDNDGKTELKSSDRGMMTGNENWEKYEAEKGKPGDEEKSELKEEDEKSEDRDVYQPVQAGTTSMNPLSTTDFDIFEDETDNPTEADEEIGFENDDDKYNDDGDDDDDDDDDDEAKIDMNELELLPFGNHEDKDSPIGDFEENGGYYDDDDGFDEEDLETSKHSSDSKGLGKQEKSGHGASVEIIKESSTNFKFSVGLFIIVVVTVIALFIYWNWNTVERFILLRRLTPGRKKARGADEEKLLGPEAA